MSSTGKSLREGIKSAVFGDSYSGHGKDQFTSFSGSKVHFAPRLGLLCMQKPGPTLQHSFLIDSWVKMVTCSLHDHLVHNQPSCVPPATGCSAYTTMVYCTGLREASPDFYSLCYYGTKDMCIELTEESHFTQREHLFIFGQVGCFFFKKKKDRFYIFVFT